MRVYGGPLTDFKCNSPFSVGCLGNTRYRQFISYKAIEMAKVRQDADVSTHFPILSFND